MKATQMLMDEHRVIERVLSSMEAAVARSNSNEGIRSGFFIDAADVIQGFADRRHHKKEEGVLFEEMLARGLPREGGPIGVMLAEHEEGRGLTRAMRAAADRWRGGDASARGEVIRNAQAYVALLRQHIAKEDNILYPMADQIIPAEDQERLAEAFERIEHEEGGEAAREKYLKLAESMEKEIQE